MPRQPRRVSFSNTSTLCVVENETKGLEADLWYNKEDIELENFRISQHVRTLRAAFNKSDSDSTLGDDSTANESKSSNNSSLYATDVVGLDKYLSADLTEEYRLRRKGRTQAVLHEQRTARRRSSMSDLSALTERSYNSEVNLSSMVSNLDSSFKTTASAASESEAEAIAKVARRHSKWARRRARAMALFLEKDEGHPSSSRGTAQQEAKQSRRNSMF